MTRETGLTGTYTNSEVLRNIVRMVHLIRLMNQYVRIKDGICEDCHRSISPHESHPNPTHAGHAPGCVETLAYELAGTDKQPRDLTPFVEALSERSAINADGTVGMKRGVR